MPIDGSGYVAGYGCRSASGGRTGRGAPVLDRHDNDSVLVFEIGVHHDHPPPRTEDEAEVRPSSAQLGSQQRKAFERPQRALQARLRVRRQAVSEDQAVEILGSCRGELDPRHELQLVERDRLPRPSLLEPELGALEARQGCRRATRRHDEHRRRPRRSHARGGSARASLPECACARRGAQALRRAPGRG